MKLKKVIILFLLSILLISLTACDTAKDLLAIIQGTGELVISANTSEIEGAIKNSEEIGIQSVAEERFDNYTIIVTIEHKDTSEIKSQQKSVNYEENASFSFNELTPGNWEVQATLEADYTGEEGHVLETGEDLNDVKIAESNKETVEVKENETTTADNLTLALVQGKLALKVGEVSDSSYQLNEIRLLDNDDQVVKSDDSISFGEEVDSWYSELSSNTHHLEVDWSIGGSDQQQDRLLIPIPALTQKVEVDFYDGEAYIMIGWDMPPAVPKNLSGTLEEVAVGEFNISLNWDGVVNADKYIIERKVDNDPWEQLAEVTNTGYIDSAIENDKDYQYAVMAEDGTGRSSDRSQPTEEISIPEKVVFAIKNIEIEPDAVGQGGNLELRATIDNKANYETEQDIVLEINFGAGGKEEKTENITLAAYESETVVFNVDVPDDADSGETTATVSSDHDSSDQSFYLGLQKITFAEQNQINGVTITIEDNNGSQVAQVETGSYASGKAVGYLESGDYDYTAAINGFEYSSSFSVEDADKTESFRLDFAGGDGTEAEPYLITNWYHLDNLRDYGVEDGSNYQAGTYFALDDDLDSSTIGYDQFASATANDDKGWDPLGEIINKAGTENDEYHPFTGVFDGQENVISDLIIDRDSEHYIALFAFTEGSDTKIQNLSLQNVDIIGNGSSAGLVGTAGRSNGPTSGGSIENCSVTGSVTGYTDIGGLIGYAKGVIIKDSHTEVTVVTVDDVSYDVGGLVGYTTNSENSGVIIENCYALGDVTGTGDTVDFVNNIGGLIGSAGSGEIRDSYAKGEVSVPQEQGPPASKNIGGLVGKLERDMNIINCYAEGDVSGRHDKGMGGLVGRSWGTVKNSYALGTVKSYGEAEVELGGLIGYLYGTVKNSYALGEVILKYDGDKDLFLEGTGGLIGYVDYKAKVENCYAAGPVTDQSAEGVRDENYIGGLVGHNHNIDETTNSFYDKDTTGQSSSDGGTPKTTAEMMQEATFASWDFTDIWTIKENSSYPYLQWQNENIPAP